MRKGRGKERLYWNMTDREERTSSVGREGKGKNSRKRETSTAREERGSSLGKGARK